MVKAEDCNICKKVLSLFLFLCATVLSFAQIDTSFWFAVPRLTHDHPGHPVKLCISTFGEPATVTVTKPAANNQVITTFNVAANSSGQYELVADNTAALAPFECSPNEISNKAIFIHSTAKINAYVSVMRNNSEIYALKGKNGLGKKFYIPMQFSCNNAHLYQSDPCRNSVEVIATEDNTVVKIVPSVALYGNHPAGQEIQVTLNRGQVYCFASASKLASQHLNGTTIESNKPIVVDISDDSATPDENRQDLVADQIVPEDMAGSEYIVIPSPSAAGNNVSGTTVNGLCDFAYIFPLEDGTNVNVNHFANATTTTPTTTTYSNLDRGDKKSFHFTNNRAIYINSDKPILVFQLTGAGGELGGTLLPHTYCTGSRAVSYRPQSLPNSQDQKKIYLNLVCSPFFKNHFSITAHQSNGTTNTIQLSANDWKQVPGHVMEYCCINSGALNSADYITVTNSRGKFHLGVTDWNENNGYLDCSISYFSEYNSGTELKWDTLSTHSQYCQGDTINFAFDTVGVKINRITGPNNYEWNNGDSLYITNVNTENSGLYVVLGEDSQNCLNETFTDSIHIVVNPVVDTIIRDTICLGDPYTEHGFNIPSDSTLLPGLLRDTLTLQQTVLGCDSIVMLELTVRDSIKSEFDMTYCNQYEWNGQIYTHTGDFTQTLSSVDGCDSIVTMHLTIIEPEVSIISSNFDFCEYDETTLTAVSDFDKYIWNTGDTTESIYVNKPGSYKVTVTDETGLCQATNVYEIAACTFNIFLPTAITPSKNDGDSKNDVFYLPPEVHKYIKDFSIEIYNRWGGLVFKSNDMHFTWDGSNVIEKKDDKNDKINYSNRIFIYVITYTNLDGKKITKRGEIVVL